MSKNNEVKIDTVIELMKRRIAELEFSNILLQAQLDELQAEKPVENK